MSAAMVNIGLISKRKSIPNSPRDRSCLRLRWRCCEGAPLEPAAESALFRNDLSQMTVSTNCCSETFEESVAAAQRL
jgi:hypothetical protein